MKTQAYLAPACGKCGKPKVISLETGGWRCPHCPAEAAAPPAVPPASALPPSNLAALLAPPEPVSPVLAPAVPPSSPEQGGWVGKTLAGRYLLEEFIRSGGMGAVYRGVHIQLKARRAIKLLKPRFSSDPNLVARFLQEAQIASSITHPGVARVFDCGTESGIAYYVMELLPGITLVEWSRRQEKRPLGHAIRLMSEVCEAVGAAHALGVIHRDLKPDNIFVVAGPDGADHAKVLDFGLSKAASPLTLPGSVLGTPGYMSPEQASGQPVDHRSDVYALGVVLYELVSGALPFRAGATPAEPPEPLSRKAPGLSVPAALDQVVARALAKSPSERFQSVAELANALRGSLAECATSSGPLASPRTAASLSPPPDRAFRPAGGLAYPLVNLGAQPAPKPDPAPRPETRPAPTPSPTPRRNRASELAATSANSPRATAPKPPLAEPRSAPKQAETTVIRLRQELKSQQRLLIALGAALVLGLLIAAGFAALLFRAPKGPRPATPPSTTAAAAEVKSAPATSGQAPSAGGTAPGNGGLADIDAVADDVPLSRSPWAESANSGGSGSAPANKPAQKTAPVGRPK